MRLRNTRTNTTIIHATRSVIRRAGAVLLLATFAAVPALAQDAPPPDGGLFAIEGKPGDDPHMLLSTVDRGALLQAPAPALHLSAEGVGWASWQSPVFVLTGSTRPWRMRLLAESMLMQDNPDHRVELRDVEARDVYSDTAWASFASNLFWQNPDGNPEQYLQLEFRVNVRPEHAAGQYICPVTLDWGMPPSGGLPPTGGTINLELHLDVPEMLSVEMEDLILDFGETDGNETGWIYTDEGLLRITSNANFSMTISSGDDLVTRCAEDETLEHAIQTALRLRRPFASGADWQTWGDLGGDASGAPTTPWNLDPDDGSPWPGPLESPTAVIETSPDGVNLIGITGAAWRQAAGDVAGSYGSTVKITVAAN